MSAFATRFGVRAVLVCQAVLGFAVVGSGSSAWANAGVIFHSTNGPDISDYAPVSLSRSADYSNTLADSLVLGAAALDTGALKVAATYKILQPEIYWLSGTRNVEVLALFQDTVTFGGPTAKVPAKVKLQFDGSFNMTGSSGLGEIRVTPSLSLSNYGSLAAGVDRLYNPSGISNGGVAQDKVSYEFVGTPGAGSFVNTSLTFVDGLLVLTAMVPRNTPITLNTQLNLVFDQLTPGVRAQADFSKTATLSIELPQGYSYTSASGKLLTASAVPEPSAFALMGLGLAALQIRRRQLIRSQSAPR